jgi:hypothetical protein
LAKDNPAISEPADDEPPPVEIVNIGLDFVRSEPAAREGRVVMKFR